MSVLLDRGIQVIATETYSVKSGTLVIAASREQGRDALHVAILTPGDSIASMVATKDIRLVTLPFRMDGRDVNEETITARANALEAVASLNTGNGGELLASLKSQLQLGGVDFSKDFKRFGAWAEHRYDWKAKVHHDGQVIFSKRFHGLDNSLEGIDFTSHYVLNNGKLGEVEMKATPMYEFEKMYFN